MPCTSSSCSKKLCTKTHSIDSQSLVDGKAVSLPVAGELFDVEASFEVGSAKQITVDIGGNAATYDVAKSTWNGAVSKPVDGKISLRVPLDRSLQEVWGNDGAVVITGARGKRGAVNAVTVKADGDGAKLLDLQVHELKSIWR